MTSSIITTNAEGIVISYEYQNEPNYDTVSTMQIHRGFTRLTLSTDKRNLMESTIQEEAGQATGQ